MLTRIEMWLSFPYFPFSLVINQLISVLLFIVSLSLKHNSDKNINFHKGLTSNFFKEMVKQF